ncbi:Aldehyde/histidinol dehydrogenase [Lipomyces arxii]|uniref:Aldehyde/histidinol dehydrogenase n=1 Tax=Lipomyces arxii TaxID=56418 RepID=UPI0034CEF546
MYGFTTRDMQIAFVAALPLIYTFYKLATRSTPLPEILFKFPNDQTNVPIPADAPDRPGVVSEYRPEMIHCYCPATGRYLGRFPASTKANIDVAVAKCVAAQNVWKSSSFADRARVLKAMLEFIKANQDDIVRIACRDSGKTKVDAALGEIMVTLEKLSWTLKHGESALRPSKRPGPSNLLIKYKSAEVVYQPLGVVLAIVSWNYPLHNFLNPVISAIYSGNAIVVKCSESVLWSSTVFADFTKTVLKACNAPEDLVQLVCPWPTHADYLTSHADISHVTFIGSKPVAHRVLAATSKSLTPVTIELGGKDAAVVLDEYQSSWDDCSALASVLMRGSFQSTGQNCIGIERIIAQPKAYDALKSVLAKRIPKLRLGSVLDQDTDIDLGAMINSSRFDSIESLITDAVSRGATLLYGGKRYSHPIFPLGSYFNPTLLADVTPDMPIARAELFAPVVLLMRAATPASAVIITNSANFGLGGAVFGKRGSADTESIVRDMKTGNIAVNDFATFYVCQLPFGGVRDSGYGKFGGVEGLQALCLAKSVCRDAYPGISTSIPPVVDYPLRNVKVAWNFVKALNTASYATSVYEFGKNIALLLTNLKA